jgi:hypothetical protein
METLQLYQKISDIRPQELVMPYLKPSAAKVQFNLKELQLHYFEEFGAYITAEKLEQFKSKKGGAEKQKITVLEY